MNTLRFLHEMRQIALAQVHVSDPAVPEASHDIVDSFVRESARAVFWATGGFPRVISKDALSASGNQTLGRALVAAFAGRPVAGERALPEWCGGRRIRRNDEIAILRQLQEPRETRERQPTHLIPVFSEYRGVDVRPTRRNLLRLARTILGFELGNVTVSLDISPKFRPWGVPDLVAELPDGVASNGRWKAVRYCATDTLGVEEIGTLAVCKRGACVIRVGSQHWPNDSVLGFAASLRQLGLSVPPKVMASESITGVDLKFVERELRKLPKPVSVAIPGIGQRVLVRQIDEKLLPRLEFPHPMSKDHYVELLLRLMLPDFASLVEAMQEYDNDPTIVLRELYECLEDRYNKLAYEEVELPIRIPKKPKIPLSKLLPRLREELPRRIVGQTEAVNWWLNRLGKVATGLGRLEKPGRPVGSALFLGPPGVGKTEIAKGLAELLGAEFIFVPGQEFASKHDRARMGGAPPGFIGYNDGGLFSRAPKSGRFVMLIDEADLLHSTALSSLENVLEEGVFVDAKDRTIRFEDALVLLTSNLGADGISKASDSIGFGGTQPNMATIDRIVEKAMAGVFRKAFRDRLDTVIMFRGLGIEDCTEIARIHLQRFVAWANTRGHELHLASNVAHFIAEKRYSTTEHARNIRRGVEELVEDPLSLALSQANGPQTIWITVNDDADVVRVVCLPRRDQSDQTGQAVGRESDQTHQEPARPADPAKSTDIGRGAS